MRPCLLAAVTLATGLAALPAEARREPAGRPEVQPAVASFAEQAQAARAATATRVASRGGRRQVAVTPPPPPDPGTQCRQAIAAAEQAHGIAPGLLGAIARVESGRPDPRGGGGVTPWPWTINAEGQGRFFETKAEAVAAVQELQARGVQVIDVGCMQVNLFHHPAAFASLEEAFDPVANARYAGLFLKRLHAAAGGDWEKAAGHYHSTTPERAEGYRAKVLAAWTGAPIGPAGLAAAGGEAVAAATAQRVFRVNGTTVRALALNGRPDLTGERAALLSTIAVPVRPTGQMIRGRPVFMVEVADASGRR